MTLLIPKDYSYKRVKDKRSRPPNAQEKSHMDRIGKMGCLVCGAKCELHHEKDGPGAKRDHRLVTPLCPLHHRHTIHGRHGMGHREFELTYGINLLEWSKEQWDKY